MSGDGIELVEGRSDAPFTNIHDWVTLSDIDPLAKQLYTIYRTHVNSSRGDDKAWPTQIAIAEMLGVSRTEKVTELNRILEEFSAIEIRQVGMPRHNVYVIHKAPPAGYSGPTTIKEWYERKADVLAAKRATKAAKAERARQRRRSAPVTPESGVLVTPKSEVLVTPESGAKQEEENKEEENKEELSAARRRGTASPQKRRGSAPKTGLLAWMKRDDVEALALAATIINGEGDRPEVLVRFLRKTENVTTTRGSVQKLIDDGEAGVIAKYEKALEWDEGLRGQHEKDVKLFVESWHFSTRDAMRLADVFQETAEIRCNADRCNDAVNKIWNTTKATTARPYIAALSPIIAERELERDQEREDKLAELRDRKAA